MDKEEKAIISDLQIGIEDAQVIIAKSRMLIALLTLSIVFHVIEGYSIAIIILDVACISVLSFVIMEHSRSIKILQWAVTRYTKRMRQ